MTHAQPPRNRLTIRFTGLAAGAMVITVAAAVVLGMSEVRAARADLDREGTALATMLATDAEPGVSTGSSDLLEPIVEGLRTHPEVAYVRLMDRRGAVLLERRFPGAPSKLEPSVLDETADRSVHRGRTREYLEISAPIGGGGDVANLLGGPGARSTEPIGRLRLGLKTDAARAQVRATLVPLACVTVLSLLLMLGATFWLGRRITGPLDRLVGATVAIADGDPDPDLDIRTGAEIETPAMAFAGMAGRLRASRARIEEYQRSLERNVEERTAELEQTTKRAVDLATEAEEASRAKSQFLANMSRELRTPLNDVIGTLDLLRQCDLAPDEAELARTACDSADALLRVIDDVLDFTNIEAGRLSINDAEFDLRAAIEETFAEQAGAAGGRPVELICRIPETLPGLVVGDGAHVRQVLHNLIGNAIKFTDCGEVEVAVTARDSGDGARRYRFEVRDTGIGIPAAAAGRLFQSFMKVDDSNPRRHGGTGLGLAIARELVQAMGGQIGVESTEGRGSLFWFELPFRGRNAHDDPVSARSRQLDGCRILVADSNAAGREALVAQLKAWNTQPSAVSTSAEALRSIRTEAEGPLAFDVLIANSTLTDIDGVTLARRIRRDPAIGGLPIVILRAPDAEADAPGSAGLFVTVDKPVHRRSLCESLCQVLDAGGRGRHLMHAMTTVDIPPANAGTRVLLAEDYDVNLHVALAIIEKDGYDVEVARNGQEAVDRFGDNGPFAAVIMDCMMPVVDGYTAATRIRGIEQERDLSRTPIIALTAAALKEDRDRCFAAGMDDYLTKPVRGHELRAALARWTSPRAEASAQADRDQTVEPVIDEVAIANLRGLRNRNVDVLGRMIEAWVRDTPLKCAALRDAADRADVNAFRRTLHAMRSASRALGAMRVAGLCLRLDAAAVTNPEAAFEPAGIAALAEASRDAMARLAEIAARDESWQT